MPGLGQSLNEEEIILVLILRVETQSDLKRASADVVIFDLPSGFIQIAFALIPRYSRITECATRRSPPIIEEYTHWRNSPLAYPIPPSTQKITNPSYYHDSSASYCSFPFTFRKNSLTLPTSTSSPLSLSIAATSPSTMPSTLWTETPVHIATTRRSWLSSSEDLLWRLLACNPSVALFFPYAVTRARRTWQGGKESR